MKADLSWRERWTRTALLNKIITTRRSVHFTANVQNMTTHDTKGLWILGNLNAQNGGLFSFENVDLTITITLML